MTEQLTLEQAAEIHALGITRAKNSGALLEREIIFRLLSDPEFHDEVDRNWCGDATIYEVIVELLRNRLAKSTK